jgi:2-polyprenyl-3-methyl-5-hydroxy-6-metoxy-1,4-benzoquinol methylase
LFTPLGSCWICGGTNLVRFHSARFDFGQYADEDRELHAYTGATVWIVRCAACGFGQPEALPSLPRFFDRMYAQRWSEEWIAREFDADYKDFIFRSILRELARRTAGRRLLDVGAHAGRFLSLARSAGWEVEGVELNPRTAQYAANRTGAAVRHLNAHQLVSLGRRYSAVVLTDVLEHIPDPVGVLSTLAGLTEPGGCIAVKVPCGPSQAMKEGVLAALTGHTVSLADNLVHVNHFTPGSLTRALERARFTRVTVRAGAPELVPSDGAAVRSMLSNALRRAVYGVARLPGAVHTPLALNLQAYAAL